MQPIYLDLAIESRRAILRRLLDGACTVTELVEATGLTQPNVSNHLAKMREHRTVRVTRSGRQMIYRLASPEISDAVRMATAGAEDAATTNVNFQELAEKLAHFGVMGDETGCTHIVDFVLRTHQPLLDIYEDLIGRAMMLVGRKYDRRSIDEAQEHAASAITERLLARISAAYPPARCDGPTVVLGCAANNWHTIGLRMIADLLRSNGWRVIYLGANVPTEAFMRSVKQHAPHIVLVSSSSESVTEARSLIRALHRDHPEVLLGVGGSGVVRAGEQFADLPASFRGLGLRDTAAWLDAVRETSAG